MMGRKLEDLAGEDYQAKATAPSIQALEKAKASEVLDLIDRIVRVNKVKPRIAGDLYEYRFLMRAPNEGSEKELRIPSSRMLSTKMFAQRHLEEFDRQIPEELYRRYIWGLFTDALSETGLLVEIEKEGEDSETFDVDSFIREVQKLTVTENKSVFKKNHRKILRDGEKLYLAADQVKMIRDNLHLGIKHERFVYLLTKLGYLFPAPNDRDRVWIDRTKEGQVWSYVFYPKLMDELISAENDSGGNR